MVKSTAKSARGSSTPRKKRTAQAKRFWQAAHEQGFTSVTQVATAAGISVSHLASIVRGESRWTDKMLHRIASVLKVSSEWLDTGQGSVSGHDAELTKAQRLIPVVGYATADTSEGRLTALEHPMELYDIGGHCALVKIAGDSLAPVALHGQHVFVDLSDRSVKDGDLVVVETHSGHTYAKRVFLTDDHVILTSINPVQPLPPITIQWDDIVRGPYVIVGVWFS